MINTVILILVIISFLMIITEDLIHINKAKTTLFFGTLCWILAFIFPINNNLASETTHQLNENLLEIATLWLFLMSAMTFVAYLNSKGFISALVQRILPERISERGLMFVIAIFAFVFSSFADNVTATLVSIAVVMNLQLEVKKRLKYATLIIFSVNSGGVSLITGDVTTLMIFLENKVTISNLLILILPSFLGVLTLASLLSMKLSGEVKLAQTRIKIAKSDIVIALIFVLTISGTLLANVLFHIPPVLTFLFGLSIMFLVANLLPNKNNQDALNYIREVEYDALLFFLGVLLLVGILKEIGVLNGFTQLYQYLPAITVNYLVGFMSSVIDNVPLTAALLKSGVDMKITEWLMLTYATGVGGSILVIGSAAGIIAMSKVKGLNFISYLRNAIYLIIAYTVGYIGVYFAANWALA
ncbi:MULTISPECIES: sodium:proton antiporter NhaD [Colwellia]|uniref:Putative Na+/H+ antiporter NhaD n=1 Tax=Colwellia psychrerythraea (strain 34H / ATCC BAA-681) TaxID=167879 RepID=Q480L5_COLP3|nr:MULTISPECIES: sodium:proton antiporter NhaD [Colwellia]AAZ25557.1 putative Na+/H+ antiporter NhaD [Colwellia psychrerythraea 34H]